MMRVRFDRSTALALAGPALLLSGCVAAAAAGAAVNVTGTVVETGVSAAGAAVGVTTDIVGAASDAVFDGEEDGKEGTQSRD